MQLETLCVNLRNLATSAPSSFSVFLCCTITQEEKVITTGKTNGVGSAT